MLLIHLLHTLLRLLDPPTLLPSKLRINKFNVLSHAVMYFTSACLSDAMLYVRKIQSSKLTLSKQAKLHSTIWVISSILLFMYGVYREHILKYKPQQKLVVLYRLLLLHVCAVVVKLMIPRCDKPESMT